MSFDLFLHCVDTGEPSGIPRAKLRSLFPIIEEESDPDYWSVRYDSSNSCNVGVGALPSNNEILSHIFVHRPCGDRRLWEALLQVLGLAPFVLYFPGGPPIVAQAEVGAALPEDMVASIGQPRCVQSVAEILKILSES